MTVPAKTLNPAPLNADAAKAAALTADTVELVRELVRAACVNTGEVSSGQEIRGVRVLMRFLEEARRTGRLETQIFEAAPGRASLIARVRGTDPTAPALGMIGHLDVVPAKPAGWLHDPFGGDLVTDEHGKTEIWGRGTVDMLYLTAAFAVAVRELALAPTPLRGDLVLLAVADEEAGGEYGVRWLLREHADRIGVTEVVSETGGMRVGQSVAIDVAEKGSAGRRLIVHGSPAHASIPYGTKNAAVAAGDVLHRLGMVMPAIQLSPLWKPFIMARVSDPDLVERLLDPVRLDASLPRLEGTAGYAHAASRITISPTVLTAGLAHNVIPGEAHIDLDIRTLPGTTDEEVDGLLRKMLEGLSAAVDIQHLKGWPATSSPVDNPLFHAISRAVEATDGSPVIPFMAAGGSDARYFRDLGMPAYGFGLLSPEWSYERYRERIHARNERIDVESVRLTLEALRRLVHDRLG